MRKAAVGLQRYWRSHWGPLAGVITGLAFAVVQLATPHVGDGCGRLGQVTEEWQLGAAPQHMMCIATLQGDLVYERIAMPKKQGRQTAAAQW